MKFILLLGRLLFSALFMLKGIEAFSKETMEFAISMGVPMPSIVVPLASIVVFLGGLSILLGYKARLGAWLIIIFLIPTTFIMHQFWLVEDPQHSMMHNYCFWKNIGLIGAALMLAYFGSGPCSLSKDCCCRKK